MSTLTTANQARDEKILGSDVLDAAQFPTIDFASVALRAAAGGGYELDGDLTLHGITRPVTLALTPHGVITDVWGKTRLGLTATTSTVQRLRRAEMGARRPGGGRLHGPRRGARHAGDRCRPRRPGVLLIRQW